MAALVFSLVRSHNLTRTNEATEEDVLAGVKLEATVVLNQCRREVLFRRAIVMV